MRQELRIGVALGGGGARGLAHIHVLKALDDLGIKPAHIAGSSIGAIMGAAYAGGMTGREIEDFALSSFATPRVLAGRLWATRPPNFKEFWADGGFRLGQLNARRVLSAFLPVGMPKRFDELSIPMTVMATDFYARRELAIRSGDLTSALAASAALPAVFRPVRRDGLVLLDGGIYSPLPFDQLRDVADVTIAVDVNGGPEGDGSTIPAPLQAMIGASQLMQQSLIETKLMIDPPDILFRPPVARFGVLDFMKTRIILNATASLYEEAKTAIGRLLEAPRFDLDRAIEHLNGRA